MYIAHCPFCDFSEESLWEDVARGEVVKHITRTEDSDHGEEGCVPGKKYRIEVEKRGENIN
jgi:hypothetical protein